MRNVILYFVLVGIVFSLKAPGVVTFGEQESLNYECYDVHNDGQELDEGKKYRPHKDFPKSKASSLKTQKELEEYKKERKSRDLLRANVYRGRAFRNMIEADHLREAKHFFSQLNLLERDLLIYYFYWFEQKDFEEKIQKSSSEFEMEEAFVSPSKILEHLTGGPIEESHFIDVIFRLKAQGLPLHEKVLKTKKYKHLGSPLSERRSHFE